VATEYLKRVERRVVSQFASELLDAFEQKIQTETLPSAEEMAYHGTVYQTRFKKMGEQVRAMKGIWTNAWGSAPSAPALIKT
jgi:hypothetical protein